MNEQNLVIIKMKAVDTCKLVTIITFVDIRTLALSCDVHLH